MKLRQNALIDIKICCALQLSSCVARALEYHLCCSAAIKSTHYEECAVRTYCHLYYCDNPSEAVFQENEKDVKFFSEFNTSDSYMKYQGYVIYDFFLDLML